MTINSGINLYCFSGCCFYNDLISCCVILPKNYVKYITANKIMKIEKCGRLLAMMMLKSGSQLV